MVPKQTQEIKSVLLALDDLIGKLEANVAQLIVAAQKPAANNGNGRDDGE